MATFEAFANGFRAKPVIYWARRPSQRSNFSMGKKFSASEAYLQSSASTPALECNGHLSHYNWNYHHPPKKMDQRSRFQVPYTEVNLPRSFEDLHRERTYLLSSLQHEDLKATEILKKLSPLEISLQNPISRSTYRKTKRQLSWLRHRLGETTKQEKSILARLGQLSWEIQSRERLVQIECERREMERFMNSHSAPWVPPNSGLDARTTQFQTSGHYIWPPQQQYYAGNYFCTRPQPSLFFGQPTAASDSGGAFINQNPFELPALDVQLQELEQEEKTPVMDPIKRSNSFSVERIPRYITCDKRMSLPTPSNEWVGIDKPIEQEQQYVGYFVQGA